MQGLKLFFSSSDEGACAHYRTLLPSIYLGKQGWRTTASAGFSVDDPRIVGADVVILQRHQHPYFLEWIPKAKAAGQTVLYDIDDSFWHIPKWNPAHAAFNKENLQIVEKIIAACDGVICSTTPLASYIGKRFNAKVSVVANYVEPPIEKPIPYTDRLKIGYCGSVTHKGDLPQITKALLHAQKKYKAHIIFMGIVPDGFPITENTTIVPPVPANRYIHQLQLIDFDIALAPLQQNFFNVCKSNLKYLEYSVCGAATVASDVFPYLETITESGAGLLASKTQDWVSHIDKLCQNPDFLQLTKVSAKQFVYSNYLWEIQAPKVSNQYEGFLATLRK